MAHPTSILVRCSRSSDVSILHSSKSCIASLTQPSRSITAADTTGIPIDFLASMSKIQGLKATLLLLPYHTDRTFRVISVKIVDLFAVPGTCDPDLRMRAIIQRFNKHLDLSVHEFPSQLATQRDLKRPFAIRRCVLISVRNCPTQRPEHANKQTDVIPKAVHPTAGTYALTTKQKNRVPVKSSPWNRNDTT
jgi:hypothetical protein